MPKEDSRYIKNIKDTAKKLKKKLNIEHVEALNIISRQNGFDNWRSYGEHIRASEQTKQPLPIPQLSLNFTQDDDIDLNEEDFDSIDEDESRELPSNTKKRILENIRSLTKAGIEFSIFEPTITGLNKSILDATQPVRTHMAIEEFHDYELQEQGPENKIIKTAFFTDDNDFRETTISLYRPKTKKGDPRMWFSGLASFAKAGDQVAIIVVDDAAYLINLSIVDLTQSLQNTVSKLHSLIVSYNKKDEDILFELLGMLKELAKKPYASLRQGDTGVGFTLETLLGIEANSSKSPDYKGIELKSGRSKTNRTTLFAQVPDWSISECKKSAEILDRYGYERDNNFKLYCTISTQKENTQGLSFVYDQPNDKLLEVHSSGTHVATWTGKQLRSRLLEKHNETLWIDVESININGTEHFQLVSAIHTKAPILSQLMPLIHAGIITMDHLIKRSGKTGRVSEKGPLFKMHKKNLELLFPEPVTYPLK
jgi:hypothetical protein